MHSRFLTTLVIFMSLVLMAVSVDSAKEDTKNLADPRVLQQFDDLEEYISGLAEMVLPRGQKVSLVAMLENSGAAYRRGQPCTAANVIEAYLSYVQALRRGRQIETAEVLYVEGRRLLIDMLASLQGDEKCSGYESFVNEIGVELKESDNKHLAATVKFAAPRMVSVEAAGRLYTQVLVSGAAHGGEPGLPGVPMVQRLVAFPRGAQIAIQTSLPTVAETIQLKLYPVQYPSPGYADDSTSFPDPFYVPPFVEDEQAYAATGPFPAEVCTATALGQFRDIPIALVSCAAGRYYPKTETYVSYDSVQWTLTFSGGSGAFMTKGSENPFEKEMMDYTDLLLNKNELPQYVEDRHPEPTCHGEELIIITHTSFRQAADKLAKWKNDKGILTSVFEVDGSVTAGQIDAFVEQRYDQCTVRPSYLLLLGDVEFVPTFYGSTVFSSQSATDFPYANYPTPSLGILDILPDFAVGRIPVDTLQQANTVVDKIIAYEGSPPHDADFYKKVSLAAMFQCCRLDAPKPPLTLDPWPTDGWDGKAYVEMSELVRDELIHQGYNVERIYSRETCDKYFWNQAHKSDDPRFYYNGTPLPVDIGEGSGFAWSGSEQDVIAAFNSGRFLIMQRDHASENGWFRPKFSKNSIGQLNNGNLLPVVFSVNCSSGLFDHETNPGEPPDAQRVGQPYPCVLGSGPSSICKASPTETYFAESLLRKPGGGAVGIIAATRDTSDLGDDALTRGLFDAVWPDIDPKVGFGATPRRRLGDILNHGKLYTLSQCGIQQSLEKPVYPLDVLAVFALFHVIGDPTLEMWTSKPFFLSLEYKLETLIDSLRIKYSIDGATITAFQETHDGRVPIGRATVKNGEATLKYVVPPEPDYPIMLSVSMKNAVSRLLTARNEPVDLTNESSFSSSAKRINFDPVEERELGEHISGQYEALGVLFVDDTQTTPLIVDDYNRQTITKSEPFSLFNDADAYPPGSASVPLIMTFINPVQRVGMYIGNGSIDGPATTAVLTAYDNLGSAIFSVVRNGFKKEVTTFIGLDVGAPFISQLKIDYGNTLLGEEIDNLMFE